MVGWFAALWSAFAAASGPFAVRAWLNIIYDLFRARLAAPVWNVKQLEFSGERRVAIVTGGNTGIGWETVRGLWLAGYHVILACRSQERGEDARARLLNSTESLEKRMNLGSLTVLPLDLSRLDSVVAFAAHFRKRWGRLHILVLNAAIMSPCKYEETADGFEAHLGVNYLESYFLVRLLEDILRQHRTRVVVVSSILALLADELRWHGAQWSKQGRWPLLAYGWSKAYGYIFTLELQRRGFDALCVHPGDVRTEVTRRLPLSLQKAYHTVGVWIFRTPAEGAATVLYACYAQTSHAAEAPHRHHRRQRKASRRAPGMKESAAPFLDDTMRQHLLTDGGCRLLRMPAWMRDPSTGQQLWALSEHVLQPRLWHQVSA
jgi:NAD(P)-dependent dehydrogenase (short-subunit alcohol dehydrogenase family)